MNRSDSPKKQPKPFGVNGQRVAILPTTPAGDNSASYEHGFPPITMILKSAGGLPPKGQDMNQILYELSALGRWSSTGALNTFDSEFASEISGYPSGAMLISNDGERIFINTTEGNLSDPNSNGAGWKDVFSYLGLGEAAKRDVGTTVGTVAAGDDLRITGALQKENNLYELTNKSDARANLGLGTVATKNVGNSAGQIPDMSYWSSPAGGINFPNGFQMRFGTIAGTGGKLFSTPFTNQCYGIVFGQTYGANYWMFSPMYRASDLSNTGFAFINKAWSGVPGVGSQDAGESVFYIAVGY
ncbi:phage tail protein [Escherichia coli]|uniref:phage tail protein n=1 Tax=Escherichia coli TaxID=562 RepID=UPI000BDE8695|nr:phage tail protein [Escherichia coli]